MSKPCCGKEGREVSVILHLTDTYRMPGLKEALKGREWLNELIRRERLMKEQGARGKK
jgi:hypothetical protein